MRWAAPRTDLAFVQCDPGLEGWQGGRKGSQGRRGIGLWVPRQEDRFVDPRAPTGASGIWSPGCVE